MLLGILVETEEGLDWNHWRATYTTAEQLGFESIWLSDHLQSPWAADRHGLDTWLALAVAASETRRLVLGPLVSPVTFREPAILGRMAGNLHDLSHGRFVLGLGLGWNADEHHAASIRFPAAADRARRLTATLECVQHELGERHIPVLIGGSGARLTLPMVARYADEWNLTTASPAVYRRAAADLERACDAIQRDPNTIRRSVATGLLLGQDAADLHARGERMRRLVPPLAEAQDVLRAARDMGWLVGVSTEVSAALGELSDAGVDRVMLGHYDLDDAGVLEELARSVLPTLGR